MNENETNILNKYVIWQEWLNPSKPTIQENLCNGCNGCAAGGCSGCGL